MARWYLTDKHYLNVPGTEWQYMEVDRQTQRQKVKKFAVPLHLDPNDPGDWNYKQGIPNGDRKYIKDLSTEDGFIVVCYEGKGLGQDIEFRGPPTPDMVPLDDEAKAITDSYKSSWIHPIEDLPIQGGTQTYSESILANLQTEVSALSANQISPRQEARDDMIADLLKSQADTQAKLMEILAALVPAAKAAPEHVSRRV